MNTNETIGTCELCGVTDHHLVADECPGCRPKCITINATAVIDPADMPIILADEDLEYWGRYFVANRFDKRGVLFETFMTDPFAIAQALLFGLPMPLPKGEEFYPLLPRQREVAVRTHPRVRAVSRPLPEMHELLDIPSSFANRRIEERP